jgi:hypothetical protein
MMYRAVFKEINLELEGTLLDESALELEGMPVI